jgi:hypothetical protein
MRLRRTLPALPLSTAAHAAVPLPAYLWCAISSNCDSAACPLAAHEAPLHPYRLHATCYCYSAACYYGPAKFRCTPYSAACDAAIPPPAIPGRRSSAARLIRLHAMLLFRGLLFQACEVPLHALFGCTRCGYSAACYSRLAKFRCMPYSAARDAAVLPPAITGPRFPLHAYSCMRCPQPTQPSMLQPSHQRMCGPEGEYNVAITPKFWGAEAHSPRRFVS